MKKSLTLDLIESLDACIDSCEESVDAGQSLVAECQGTDEIECDEERVRCIQIWESLVDDCNDTLEALQKYENSAESDYEDLVKAVAHACKKTVQIAQVTAQVCRAPDRACIDSCMALTKNANHCAKVCQDLLDELE